MALMRGSLKNTTVKLVAATAAGVTSATTMTAYPVDLESIVTNQRPTWCKIIVGAMKTGTATLANLAITPLTGTTSTCATGMSHFPVSVPVAGNVGSGAVVAGGTVESGRFVAAYDIDLTDSQVRSWLGATCVVTATTDSCVAFMAFVFGGFRELPATNTAMATMA